MSLPIRILSVRQPWSWALIHGGKDVENRNWSTNYRGLLAIHAGKAFDMTKDDFADMALGQYGEPFSTMAWSYCADPENADLRGAIIGVVELVGCIPDSQCESPWKAGGDGFFCWQVQKPVALADPITYKGMLGLGKLPDHFETTLRDAWLEAWPDPS